MKFHIVKRDNCPLWKKCCFYLAAVVLALLLGAVLLSAIGVDPIAYYTRMFTMGTIGNRIAYKVWANYLKEFVPLALVSVALSLAFRMRFWNCGAEGQALIGGLAAMVCMIELGGTMSEGLLIAVVAVASIVAGAIWGLIPALFHAQYKTNETLFTLMMNYVATQIVAYYVYITGGGSGVINPVSTGALPVIFDQKCLLNVLIVTVLMIGSYIYLKYSKHGYEISVVGESQNTARYVGINVKKVIIRTMAISGALCGVAGMLLVSGIDHSINTNTVGGQGFTAIMISWLGQFNPFIMAGMAGLVTFLQTGAAKVADSFFLNSAYADIVSGTVILFLVGCEFFIQYKIRFRHSKKGGTAQ